MNRTSGFTLALALCSGLGLIPGCKGRLTGGDLENGAHAVGRLDAGSVAVDASLSCENQNCAAGGEGGSSGNGPVICGDGEQDTGEQCDDGNVLSGDGCDDHCAAEIPPPAGPVCGDALFDSLHEECDDGNTVAGDGCDWRCRKERCGNDRRDEGEDCDPPITGLCDQECQKVLPHCGDGTKQSDEGEECDDGNTARGDGCKRCHKECGDGFLERDIGEGCEPLHALPGTCDEATCQRLPQCGDGNLDSESGEQCDPSDGVHCVDCKISLDAGASDAAAPSSECVAALPQVAVSNGTFTSDLTGWTPASATVTAVLAAAGASAAGSVDVTHNPGAQVNASVDGVFQCVPVQAGVHYTLVAKYYNAASNAAGVLPGISIQLFDNLTCSGGFTSSSGPPVSSARDTWLSFVRSIDTSALGNDGHLGSMLLKLGAIVPAAATTGTLRYDDIGLGSCGNCTIEAEAGETCDDGNSVAGDGCSAACEFECGNDHVEPPELCDDGNFTFGDSCTPTCRTMTTCDTCAATDCDAPVDACLALEGLALEGPRQGMPRNSLCAALRDCIHDSGCNLNTAIANRPTLGGTPVNETNPGVPENCYCGSSGVECLANNTANGSCKAQVEAALETTDPYLILQRVSGANPVFPTFAAVADLLTCEQAQCSTECVKALSCGNGSVEDRTQEFVAGFSFLIDRVPTPCLDVFTHTQAGCSFEECDDGNTTDGDGCDENCFVEACGNYLKQGLEECDDGNLLDGDGCDSSCVAEFVCGDATVTAPFEECEPPSTGAVCSLADYENEATRPSACGCDNACVYKVCGNGEVQEGEECDPPNGASCDPSCQRDIDECTNCILRIEEGQDCPADLLLNGNDIPGDPFAVGCLQDPICLNLWNCQRETLCFAPPLTMASCYCSPNVSDLDACENSASFVETGECKNEILTAFEAQWGRAPTNNSELLASFFDVPADPTNTSLTTANYLSSICLVPDGVLTKPTLREQLTASGVDAIEIDACMTACFP